MEMQVEHGMQPVRNDANQNMTQWVYLMINHVWGFNANHLINITSVNHGYIYIYLFIYFYALLCQSNPDDFSTDPSHHLQAANFACLVSKCSHRYWIIPWRRHGDITVAITGHRGKIIRFRVSTRAIVCVCICYMCLYVFSWQRSWYILGRTTNW